MGRCTVPVLESLPVVLAVGTVLGFLTGLGVGGGSLLVIWLTAVLGMDPNMARGINLLFFLPGAFIAICFRKKQGAVRWKNILPAVISGCAAAGICSYFSTIVDTEVLKTLFGTLLIAAGVRELLWKQKGKGGS